MSADPRRDAVLLHGQPGLGSDWKKLADLLPAGLNVMAVDRPGYGSNLRAAGGFDVNAHAIVEEMDERGIQRAVLIGHSQGGGVALSVAALAPERVEALVLLASVGPGCLNGWDRLLAAPFAGEVCALAAWWLTPWLARARLAAISRWRGQPVDAEEYVNWHVWGNARSDHGQLWRTFLTEQRALVKELAALTESIGRVRQPVLLLADPRDTLIPVSTTYQLAAALPDAVVGLLEDTGHHVPLRGAAQAAAKISEFLASLQDRPSKGCS